MTPAQLNHQAEVTKQVSIGAGKAVVSAGYHAVMQSNPVTAAIDHHIGEPKALQAKNADQAVGKIVTGVAIAVAGAAVGTSGSGSAAAGDAQAALNAAVATRAGNPAVMVGAYDATSGATAVGTSGPLSRLGTINPDLAAAADQVGGVGAMNPGAHSPVGCCAEFDAANQLMNDGSSLDNIRFTDAIRPRNGDVVPKCENCEKMFPDHK
jgi:filamentous hemagglutinin